MTTQQFKDEVTDIASYNAKGRAILDHFKDNAMGPEVRECTQHYGVRILLEMKTFLAEWTTGLGKTKVFSDAVVELGTKAKILVLHERIVHKTNLIEDFEKFHGDINKYDVTFCTYRSSHKYSDKTFDLLVLDEAHHVTDTNIRDIAAINTTYRLYLSATVPPEKRKLLKMLGEHKMVVLRISMKQAETWGVLPKVEYLLIPVFADNRESKYQYHYKKSDKTDVQYMSYASFSAIRYAPANVVITCTEAQYIQLMDLEIASWIGFVDVLKRKKADAQWVWNTKVKPLGAKRKSFYAKIKGEHLFDKLLPLIKEMRTVIFAERIDDLEGLGINCIHSKQTTEENLEIIKKFNTHKFHDIGAVNMLNESMNLVDIELSILMQLATGSKVMNVQRQGRSVRGKQPFVVLPFVHGTKDEITCKKYLEEYSTVLFKDTNELIEYVRKAKD